MPEQMVLQAEHVSLKKKNGLILDDVTLSVGEGCFFGLVGDRDAGKTAFLRVAAGLERADAGNVNICGLPAVSVPCGFGKDGLPIGMQLIGNSFDEATILNAAWQYENAAADSYRPADFGVKL